MNLLLDEITGITLPVVTDDGNATADGLYISIGNTSLLQSSGNSVNDLECEASVVKTYGESILLYGGSDVGAKAARDMFGGGSGAGVSVTPVAFLVIHPSGEPYEEAERSRRITVGIDMISRLNTVAKELGMTLALENLPRLCLCRTHDEMESFLQAIPDLRVCFDTNHNLVESNAEYIRAVGDRIVTIHVSDYDFVDERHWLPMEGKNDWEEILSVLEEISYAGRFVYELHSGPTPQDVADNYQKLMQL